MILKWNLLSIVVVLICYASPGYSSENSNKQRSTDEIEEIVVTGTQSLGRFRREAEQAENHQFKLFNDLVEDREFKILCRKTTQTGTHVKKRECEPRFMRTARRKSRSDSQPFSDIRTGAMGPSGPSYALGRLSNNRLTWQERRSFKELEELMIRLANRNPELRDAILEAKRTRDLYQVLRQSRFGE